MDAKSRVSKNSSLTDIVQNVILYESQTRAIKGRQMDLDVQDATLEIHLDDLISQLQSRLQKQQDDLESVR